MREFIYYSQHAVTAGNLIKDNLMKAGRMDIVCNVIIATFFVSNSQREDVKLHLIFDGQPNPPRHLVIESNKETIISKKNVAGLIKKMLYKSPNKEGLKEILPGCSAEKRSFTQLIKDLDAEGKNVFVLHQKGTDIRNIEVKGDEVFVIGDQEGFPHDLEKYLKKVDKITVGPKVLFASQVMTIIHNELDRS